MKESKENGAICGFGTAYHKPLFVPLLIES